jgi:hypothetical protein
MSNKPSCFKRKLGSEACYHTCSVADECYHEPTPVGSGLTQLLNRDQRLQCYAWAPGTYGHVCSECDKEFLGAKRATMCAPCAYGDC